MKCYLCPRQCGADRKENYGICLSSEALRVARVGLHFYEEPPISGSHGSGTVFFSGCSLACPFCQNYEVSHKQIGVDITAERLSELFAELEAQGAHNINLVNPTHYASQIFKALELYRPKIPIVWNTHGYETQETLSAAERYVDIYLTDYKYADPFLAKRYSKAADYPDVAFAALCTMRKQKKDVYEGDLLKQGVIVRHL
ncbi:MAG: radical SAM protein, partial [Clostridia bacterium]|nr:radical SAM protein [Clostridia bacterium]